MKRIIPLVVLVCALAAVSSSAAMSLKNYRTAIHNQYGWTNRALSNRCLDRVAWDHYTRTPLAAVSPAWRRHHVRWAKNAHHRAQDRSSACAPAVGHLALWLCIHSGYRGNVRVSTGEGAWDADTGNGYYGGLQMTYGWGILDGKASNYTPADQMHAAEVGYSQAGYSQVWLFGQWPNTAPPCV